MSRIERRPIDGILLLDKPQGITSNRALQRVRHLLRARKAGHTGSLDPLATGLLPLCFGEATKVSGFLLEADKRYRVEIRLGQTTTTGDAEGEILETRPVEMELADIEAALPSFLGEIEQVPPMYSALKHQGRRLYELAREGVEVERPSRRVHIHALQLLDWQPPTLTLDVRCSKGTYIRSLAEDLGQTLGTGGHVISLRRTELGPFQGEPMLDLGQVEALAEAGPDALKEALLPVDAALKDWPELHLGEEAAFYLCQGQAVFVPKAPTSGMLRLYGPGGRFLGMGAVQSDGRVAPKRLLARSSAP